MKRKFEKRDLYKEVTQRFVDALKNGAAPWIKPWSEGGSTAGRPSKRRYIPGIFRNQCNDPVDSSSLTVALKETDGSRSIKLQKQAVT